MRSARLIIQCESCDTRFRLDESRIPAQGARVRCSRCKTAFFVANPEASPQEALDEVVAEATDPGGAIGPAATQDLFEAGGADLGNSAAGATAQAASPADDDDELWEFEDAVPSAAATPEPPPSPAPPPPPPAPEPVLAEPQVPEPAPPEPVKSPAPRRVDDVDDFELDSDLSGLDLAETLGEVTDASPMVETLVSEEAGLDPMAGPDPTDLSATTPDAGLDDDAEGLGGLGAPEDWDFLGESSESIAEAATFTEEAPPRPQAPESDIFAERDSEQPIGEPVAAAVMAEPTQKPASASAPRSWQPPSIAPGVNAIGWLLAGALLLFGFSRALLPSLPPALSVAEPRSFDLGFGEATQVTAHYIDNAWTGPLFVVEGMYEPTETPTGPTTLRMRWLDANGQPIGGEVQAVAGDGLGHEELRELQPSASAAILAGTGPDFNFGGSFSLVPGAVPDAAADFDLVLEVGPARVVPPAAAAEVGGEAG
jgi:predicted Zn finger-like uncharacterized protein